MMEPLNGFEPLTVRLQGGCSTPELKRRSDLSDTPIKNISGQIDPLI